MLHQQRYFESRAGAGVGAARNSLQDGGPEAGYL